MAQPYCVSQMLNALAGTDIPNKREAEFVANCQYKKKGTFSPDQYNKVIDLYNKYIAVPAAIPSYKYDGSTRG